MCLPYIPALKNPEKPSIILIKYFHLSRLGAYINHSVCVAWVMFAWTCTQHNLKLFCYNMCIYLSSDISTLTTTDFAKDDFSFWEKLSETCFSSGDKGGKSDSSYGSILQHCCLILLATLSDYHVGLVVALVTADILRQWFYLLPW